MSNFILSLSACGISFLLNTAFAGTGTGYMKGYVKDENGCSIKEGTVAATYTANTYKDTGAISNGVYLIGTSMNFPAEVTFKSDGYKNYKKTYSKSGTYNITLEAKKKKKNKGCE